MKNLRIVFEYIKHRFTATNSGGHGVHSPYLFQFIQQTIYNKYPFSQFYYIEKRRQELLEDDREIFVENFGTGNSGNSKVAKIAANSLKRAYWSQLLFRIANFTKVQKVLELGTSLGISGSYLAACSSQIEVITMEGSDQIAKIAEESFAKIGIDNCKIVVGNIDKALPKLLLENRIFDLIFIDANHKKSAVMNYFETILPYTHSQTIVILDDIHWSKDMTEAWKELCKHPKVTATLDLFELGIIFLNPSFPQKTFKLKAPKI